MFQGPKKISKKNYDPFIFDPKEIDYIFLTHAHIDHSGLIPKMYKKGFRWKIFATSATIDLCKILFEDSADIQYHNIQHENRRRERIWLEPREPLFSKNDARECMRLFAEELTYTKKYTINDQIKTRYQDAGHILWSASIELRITENNKETKFVFSGDIGQRDAPIIKDPTLIEEADYVFVESTYGNRLHDPIENRDEKLLKCLTNTYNKGGKVLVPSFAIERTQEFLYSINKLIQQKKFPPQKIYLDSPLAIKATEIFKKHRKDFDQETLEKYTFPFSFDELETTQSVQDSMKINRLHKPCIVIAGNWMCTAGRIRHHIKHNIRNPNTTLLFIGYQAKGTLGRRILEGEKRIKMMGDEIIVEAEITKLNSFSAHADANGLVKRMKGFQNKPKKVFVVHGEQEASEAFKTKLEELNFSCHIPEIGESLEII